MHIRQEGHKEGVLATRSVVGLITAVCLFIGGGAIAAGAFTSGTSAYAAPNQDGATEIAADFVNGAGGEASGGEVAAQDCVTNEAGLRDAISKASANKDTVICLNGTVDVASTIEVGNKRIVLQDNNDGKADSITTSSNVTPFSLTNGTELTINASADNQFTYGGTEDKTLPRFMAADNATVTINGGTYSHLRSRVGAVINAANSTVAINGGKFEHNAVESHIGGEQGGGVIYASGGMITIAGGVFSFNTAVNKGGWSEGGGAIYATNNATINVRGGAQFIGNKAVTNGRLCGGGAIWVQGNISINDATFSNNVHDPTGGWHFGGGAIYVSGGNPDAHGEGQADANKYGTLNISKATFMGNEAKSSGGSGDGGAIFVGWYSTAIIHGDANAIQFTNNKATRLGGAIYTEEQTVTYMAKAFATQNTAGHFGGGLWLCPSGQGVSSKGSNMITVGNDSDTKYDRYANGELGSDKERKEPTSGAAGADFAIMSPTKPGISHSFELTNDGWGEEANTKVVNWYRDGELNKYTDGLSVNSLLDGDTNKGMSVAKNSQRYDASNPVAQEDGSIASENVSGKKNEQNKYLCSGNTEDCVKNVGVALKATMDSNKAKSYKAMAAVLFTNNHADSSGGAFGTNGVVVFSTPYNAAWRKVDERDVQAQKAKAQQDQSKGTKAGSDINALSGSEWTLSIKQSQMSTNTVNGQEVYATSNGQATPYFEVNINTTACANDQGLCWRSDNDATDPTWTAVIKDNKGYDGNATDGEFGLINLAGGTFTLKETEAPEGYYKSTKTYTFKTGGDTALPTVLVDGKDVLSKSTSGVSQIGDDVMPDAVAWSKVDADSTTKLLPGSEWQLLKKGLDGQYAVVTGYNRITDCVSGNCSSSVDKDAAIGKFKLPGLSAGDYQLKEIKAPTGYDSDRATSKAYSFTIPDKTNTSATPGTNVTLVDGVYVVGLKDGATSKFDSDKAKTNVISNTRKTGAVSWAKTDASADAVDGLLSGSEWQLEIKSGDDWKALSYNANANGTVKWSQTAGNATPTTITDCDAQGCSGVDRDSTAGKFNLTGLGWGTYRIVETKAPNKHVLPDKNTTWYEFTVGVTYASGGVTVQTNHTGDAFITLTTSTVNGSQADTLLVPGSAAQGSAAEQPNIIKNVAAVSQLPLTGGLTGRSYALIGLALFSLAMLAVAATRRKGMQ